jgi:hypothetical protein
MVSLGGSKGSTISKLGADSKSGPSPLLGGGASTKKDYAKKQKNDMTELGSSPFGMTGLTGET